MKVKDLSSNTIKSKEIQEILYLLFGHKDSKNVVEVTFQSLPKNKQTYSMFVKLFSIARRFKLSKQLKRVGGDYYECGKKIYPYEDN